MITARRFWGTMIAANVLGAVLVLVGAWASAAMQALGFILLLPGSLAATLLPLQRLWTPSLWRCCQTDAAGLANVLFLPVAVAINVIICWSYRVYKLRRTHSTALLAIKSGAANSQR